LIASTYSMMSDSACLVESRSFVDAVAGVKTHALRRECLAAPVGGLDVDPRAPFLLRVIEVRFEEDVRQERIVHLHQKAAATIARYSLFSSAASAWKYSSSVL